MNPLYLAQTNIQINDKTPGGTLLNNGRNIDVIVLNGGKSFVSLKEYETQGRDCKVYLTADYAGTKNKNLINWPKKTPAELAAVINNQRGFDDFN